MTPGIAGAGWVTPLGNDLPSVWKALMAGTAAQPVELEAEATQRRFLVYRAANPGTETARHPRLRRASGISKFAAAAGLAALAEAKVVSSSEAAGRTALIYAISNGGVIYTRQFYQDIVRSGPRNARPLLFPETVFNAPASHLAALLGITGSSYTVVGDGSVGIQALELAIQLLHQDSIDRCLVVGAEEVDWLLCDAYRRWRLLRPAPPIEPYRQSPRGMVLSEGAGALLLQKQAGPLVLAAVAPGGSFAVRKDAARVLKEAVDSLPCGESDPVVASANGTFVDGAEQRALQERPAAPVYALKPALGESVGASTLWQAVAAVQILRTGEIPPTLNVQDSAQLNLSGPKAKVAPFSSVLITACGLNQQAGAACIARF